MIPLRDMPQRLLTLLRPPDLPLTDSPDDQRKYMVKVARYHLNMSLTVAILFLGAIWAASPIGFARSVSVEKQIITALEPVKADAVATSNIVKQVSEAQAVNGRLLRLSLANSVAADIRFLKSKQCKSKDPVERERYQHEIELKQDDYKTFKDFLYSIPSCDAL